MEIQKWTCETKAKDIMIRDIVTVQTSDPLHHAAELSLSQHISGTPVIDDTGACVGVLSTSDFLGAEEKVAEQRRRVVDSSFFNTNLALPQRLYAEKLEEVRDKIAPAAEQAVEHFMTSDLVSVDENAPVSTVIQYVVGAHVHRVLVLDEDK